MARTRFRPGRRLRPGAPVIAASSLTFVEGHYFSAVLHETGSGGHQIAIYDADFSPTGAALLTVRNNSSAREVSWRIFPKDVKPEIPYDARQGTLGNGQSQVAIDVTQNDYVLEFLVDGQVVGRHPDVELEHEKNRVLTLVGDPQPSGDPVVLRRHVLEEEFQVAAGPPLPDTVTPPADPMSTTDENRPDNVCLRSGGHVADARGSGAGLRHRPRRRRDEPLARPRRTSGGRNRDHGDDAGAVHRCDGVRDADRRRGRARGGVHGHDGRQSRQPRSARHVHAGRAGQADHDRAPARRHRNAPASGDVQDAFAGALLALLDQADQQLATGATAEACQSLKDVAAAVESEKDKAVAVAAAESLEPEVKALRTHLGCG